MKLMDEKGRLFGQIHLVDALVGLFLLSLASLFLYGHRLIGSRSLSIVEVTPGRITAGIDKELTIYGTGFDTGIHVRLGDLPEQKASMLNEARLVVEVPPEIPSGRLPVYVRNDRGRLVEKEEALEVAWIPEITHVKPEQLSPGDPLEIFGRYFEQDCTIHLGEYLIEEAGRGPNRLQISAVSGQQPIPEGIYPVTVTNAGGQKAVFEKGVKVAELPKILRVYPEHVGSEETTSLLIEGRYLRKGVQLELGGIPLQDLVTLEPNWIKATFTPAPAMDGRYPITVTDPSGLQTVRDEIVRVEGPSPVLLMLTILSVKESDPGGMAVLKRLPKWGDSPKGNFNQERFRVVVPGAYKRRGDRYDYFYRKLPVKRGTAVDIVFNRRKISAIVASDPVPVVTADGISDAQ